MLVDGKKAVFLDRDGTINIDKQYLYKVSDFEYINGAVEGLKELADMGFILVVITNQSGIARGYYTEEDYMQLTKWMENDMENKGVSISKSYFCPHLPEGRVPKYAIVCDCRKPRTDLFWRAAKDLNIDMDRSYAIGDKERDLAICRESGVKGILLSENRTSFEKFIVCSEWSQIVQTIKMQEDSHNG